MNGKHEGTASDGLAMPGKQINAEILPIIDDYVKCEEIVFKSTWVTLASLDSSTSTTSTIASPHGTLQERQRRSMSRSISRASIAPSGEAHLSPG